MLFRHFLCMYLTILRIGKPSCLKLANEPIRVRDPDTVIFHRVHSDIEEVSSLHDPVTKHFILADSEEQECTRTVVFAVFTACYEFFGACHWTQVTQVWDILDIGLR